MFVYFMAEIITQESLLPQEKTECISLQLSHLNKEKRNKKHKRTSH